MGATRHRRHITSHPIAAPRMTSAALQAMPLGCCEDCGHDYRARMDRTAFEGVVEILAVRGNAVAKRGPSRRRTCPRVR
jgi:hypothetical protein